MLLGVSGVSLLRNLFPGIGKIQADEKGKRDILSKMKHDILKIKSSPNVFVFVDKTTNLYEIPSNDYKGLLHENITKTYKKSTKRLENAINMEAKHIAENIKLDDRTESLAQTPAFITLKDHKENFKLAIHAA